MSDLKNKKDSLAEEVLIKIQEAVISGDLRPNQRLTEMQMSRKFGMSRTPIREAIRRLQQMGYVTILPNGGAIITEFSPKYIRDQFEIREQSWVTDSHGLQIHKGCYRCRDCSSFNLLE